MQALPEEVRKKYEDPKGGLAGVGWSRGIEVLEDGKPDLNKGSYYANPLQDVVTTDEQLIDLYPSYTTYAQQFIVHPHFFASIHACTIQTLLGPLYFIIVCSGLLCTTQHC